MSIFIKHDGGREAAGFKGSTRDCVIRSIVIVADLDYKTVYNEFRKLGKQYIKDKNLNPRNPISIRGTNPRTGIVDKIFKPYFKENLGLSWTPFQGSIYELPINGKFILDIKRHSAAFVDGFLYDAWDSSDLTILGYWSK